MDNDWGFISFCLVAFHLFTEYANYIYNFFVNQKEKSILKEILKHRKLSKKTELLKQILEDLEEIKREVHSLKDD